MSRTWALGLPRPAVSGSRFTRFAVAGALVGYLLGSCCTVASAAALPTVRRLLTEYLDNPVGIDVRVPRFSWQMVQAERGARQTAYQIQVARDPSALGTAARANTAGKLGSRPLPGRRPEARRPSPLSMCLRHRSRRGARTRRGFPTGNAARHRSGAGSRRHRHAAAVVRSPRRRLPPAVWDSGRVASAQSVNLPYAGPPLASQTSYYWRARVWDLHGQPGPFSPPARFETGLLRPEEWTGKWITAGPLPSRAPSRPAPLLRREFRLSKPVAWARASVTGLGYYELRLNGRKAGDRVLDPGFTGYGKRVLFSTYDVTPLLRVGANAVGALLGRGWFEGSPRLRLQLNIRFTDGSRASVVSDGAWRAARSPLLDQSIYDGETYDARLEHPGWDRPGFDDSAWKRVEATTGPGGVLSAEMILPIRVVQTLAPVRLTTPRPGVHVYDFGQNFAGWCRLHAKGPAGTRVTLRHAELLFPNGLINPQNLRSAKAAETYLLGGRGSEVYEPRFTYHGFRYVQIEGYPGRPTLASLQGRVVHTDLPPRGEFACSNALLNQVERNARWGLLSNFYSIPTDCPQRDERQGWLADAHLTTDMALYNFHAEPAYVKFLQDIRDAQGPDGRIPDTVPYLGWGGIPGDPMWASAYAFILWDLYRHTGDRRLLEQHFSGLVRWLGLLRARARDNILTAGHYGDWIALVRTPQPLIATGTYYRCAWIVARIAEILGREHEGREYRALCRRIAAAFNARFLNPATGEYGNGSQFSQAWPLSLEIVPAASRKAVLDQLVHDIMVTHHGHLTTGFIGTRYLLDALTREGRADVAYTIATRRDYPGWGYMVANGATTIWELWKQATGPGMNSHNHPALGSVSAWYYSALAGIIPDPDHPGYERFTVRPHVVGDLRWAAATVETLRGQVASRWTIAGDAVQLHVEVPANSRATVCVPKAGLREVQVTESGTLLWRGGKLLGRVPGIESARDEGGWVSFEVGSGSYDFRLAGQRQAPDAGGRGARAELWGVTYEPPSGKL